MVGGGGPVAIVDDARSLSKGSADCSEKSKSRPSWADMSDDNNDSYDDFSESSSWLGSTNTLGSNNTMHSQASPCASPSSGNSSSGVRKLRNRSMTAAEVLHSQGGWSSPRDTSSSQSSWTLYSSAESSTDSFALDVPDEKVPITVLTASLGSAKHDEGLCKPCLFAFTPVGCQNGSLCEFCHFPHSRKNKPRPCKGKRDRYRKLILSMDVDGGNSDVGRSAPERNLQQL